MYLEGDEKTGPLTKGEKIAFGVGAIVLSAIGLYFVDQRFDSDRVMNPVTGPTTTLEVPTTDECSDNEIRVVAVQTFGPYKTGDRLCASLEGLALIPLPLVPEDVPVEAGETTEPAEYDG